MRKPVVVLGVPIDPLSMAETLDRIVEMVKEGRSTGKTHQVATANVDFVVQAMSDIELRYLLQCSDLITADGMPLVWAIRALGVPLKGRVAGSDLVYSLAERAAKCGFSLYFLGGIPGVAGKAAGVLKEKYPGLQITGIHSPPFSPILQMDTSFLEDIHLADPDILFVALGNPKQEKWIGTFGRSLRVPVMIGVGASLDFVAGYTRRAPVWMQHTGFEWLFRLLQEPRRLFRRYFLDLVIFAPSFFRQWVKMRLAPVSGRQSRVVALELIQGIPVVNLYGRLRKDNLEAFHRVGQQALNTSARILVNLAQTTFLDSSAMGALLDLGNQARSAGGELSLAGVPDEILSALSFLKMDKLFPLYQDIDVYLAATASRKDRKTAVIPAPNPSSSGRYPWTVLYSPRILESATAPDFLNTGACLLETNPFLICDLSETVLLTSAGLAVLNRLRQMAVQRNGDLQVANCSAEVLQVIKKANYEQVLPLYPRISQTAA